jgi:hypothetical protein
VRPAIAVVLVGALAGAAPSKAEAPAPPKRLVITDVPHDGSRFGVLIVGEPDGTAVAARTAVSRELARQGHPVEIVPGLEAGPRREDVLRICAQYTLDGLAFVAVRRGPEPALAEVAVVDANGDPFRGSFVPSVGALPDQTYWTAPRLTQSSSTFTVPTLELLASAAERRPAPLGPVPPLLWFDERDGSAMLGQRALGTGEVYRLLGRPELELPTQRRMHQKHVLLVSGIAASAAAVLLAPALLVTGHEPDWQSDASSTRFVFVDGALLAAGIGALAASLTIDPNPMAPNERFARARDFNAARLPDEAAPEDVPEAPGAQGTDGGAPAGATGGAPDGGAERSGADTAPTMPSTGSVQVP